MPCMPIENDELQFWRQLSERLCAEQDPDKLVELAKEIIRTIDERRARLRQRHQSAHLSIESSRFLNRRAANGGHLMEAGTNGSHCTSCHFANQRSFTAEIAIHFPGLQGLDKPIVWVFPKVYVCLDCGHTEFTAPERELKVLQTGLPVKGAVVSLPEGDNHDHN